MNTWLTTQIGAEAANIVSYVALFIAAIIVLWLIIVIVKRLNKGTYVVGGKNRQPRLSVRDAAPIDSKRQLVLIKRDNVEHLILIGGPTDLVIERNISNSPTQMNATSDIFTVDDIANEQGANDISSIFPEANITTASQLSPTMPSSPSDEEHFALKNTDTPKFTHESQLDDHTLVSDNINTETETSHKDLTPAKVKNKENDQTLFANLAIQKGNTQRVVNTPPSDSTKAKNEANHQDVASENVTLSSEEIQPLIGNENNIGENNALPDDVSQYRTYDQDGGVENRISNSDAIEAREETIIYDDEITANNSNPLENEKSGDSTDTFSQPLEQFSSQDKSPTEENSANIIGLKTAEKSNSPIAAQSAKIQLNIGNTGNLAKIEGNIRTTNHKADQLNDGGRAAVNPLPTLSPTGQSNTFSAVKTSASSNISVPELKSNGDGASPELARPALARKRQAPQPDQSNPFGKPKPINPYKVMQESGAFRAKNNNVNFGTPLANAPQNKGNNIGNKNEAATTSDANATKTESSLSSNAVSSTADTQHDSIKVESLTSIKTPIQKPTTTIAGERSMLNNSVLANDSNVIAGARNKEQVVISSNQQSDLNESNENNLNSNSLHKSNLSSKIIDQNISNKPLTDSERLKPATMVENKTQTAQERPITQRSVPQGMLRPPLMAKPRSAATTTAPNNQTVRSGPTAKVEQNTSLTPTNTDAPNMGFKNDTTGLQSSKTVKEDVTDTVIVTNTTEVGENTQLAETETTNKTLNILSQATKPATQNKISNLQKFSLQLLEPQHILDTHSRNEGNGKDATAPIGKIDKSRDEEEFDRRLQSELDQSSEK